MCQQYSSFAREQISIDTLRVHIYHTVFARKQYAQQNWEFSDYVSHVPFDTYTFIFLFTLEDNTICSCHRVLTEYRCYGVIHNNRIELPDACTHNYIVTLVLV